MDWGVFWTAFLTSLGGTAVAISALAWLGGRWIGTKIEASVRHEYDKKLEDHRAKLERTTATALQTLKTENATITQRQKADQTLFRKLLQDLPASGCIDFIRTQDYESAFPRNMHSGIESFSTRWDNVQHEFLDPELETKRRALIIAIRQFLQEIGASTFALNNHAEFSGVPPEWRHEQPAKYEVTVKKLHALAAEVVHTHTELVRLGRERLNVSAISS